MFSSVYVMVDVCLLALLYVLAIANAAKQMFVPELHIFVIYGLTLLTTAMEVDASQVSSCMRLESVTVCRLTPRSRSPSFLYCSRIQVHFIIFASCKVVDDNALFRFTNRSQSNY